MVARKSQICGAIAGELGTQLSESPHQRRPGSLHPYPMHKHATSQSRVGFTGRCHTVAGAPSLADALLRYAANMAFLRVPVAETRTQRSSPWPSSANKLLKFVMLVGPW